MVQDDIILGKNKTMSFLEDIAPPPSSLSDYLGYYLEYSKLKKIVMTNFPRI